MLMAMHLRAKDHFNQLLIFLTVMSLDQHLQKELGKKMIIKILQYILLEIHEYHSENNSLKQVKKSHLMTLLLNSEDKTLDPTTFV